jgi:uncharacterized membrane protein
VDAVVAIAMTLLILPLLESVSELHRGQERRSSSQEEQPALQLD